MLVEIILYKQQHGISNCGQQKLQSAEAAVRSVSCLSSITVDFFEGFNGMDTVPSAFVLMGNFQSQPATTASTDYSVIREQFKSLATVISQYQHLQVCLTRL